MGQAETKTGWLTYPYKKTIYICMKTTLNIDDKILEEAARLTGIKEKTALVRRGLETLIAQESSRRLANLGGTEKDIKPTPRRRSAA
jgi:Arc/MetJ family transcription regulator